MKKRWMGVFLCFIMMLTLTGCRSKVSDEALNKLEKAIVQIADMKSTEYEIQAHTVVDNKKQITKLHGAYDIAGSKPRIKLQVELEQGSQKVGNYYAFYVYNDMIYTNYADAYKSRMPLSILTQGKELPLKSNGDSFKIPKDQLKKVLKEAKLKGDTLTLEFDCEKLQDVLNNEASIKKIEDAKSFTFKRVSVVAKLKNDYITSANISMQMEQVVNEKSQSYKATIQVTFKDINAVKDITFPDFSDYQEIYAN